MKSLTEYIKSVNEAKSSKMFRFVFGDLANAAETISSIESLASKAGIYTEKIDGGIKIKQVDNKDAFTSIKDTLQSYVDGLEGDEKADQNKVQALADQLNKLSSWLEEEPKEEEPSKEKTEEGEDE